MHRRQFFLILGLRLTTLKSMDLRCLNSKPSAVGTLGTPCDSKHQLKGATNQPGKIYAENSEGPEMCPGYNRAGESCFGARRKIRDISLAPCMWCSAVWTLWLCSVHAMSVARFRTWGAFVTPPISDDIRDVNPFVYTHPILVSKNETGGI